jgi:alkylation response protein AidB-like acyl-CoA dehydrogenase
MDLALSAEQRQFAVALRDLLAAASGPASARSWAAGDLGPGLGIWRSLAAVGVPALAIPAHLGGLGAHPADLVIACEELGRHLVPGPVAESLGAVPRLLAAAAAAEPDAAGWLQQLAAGDLIATLAAPPVVPFAADTEAAGLVVLADDDELWLAAADRRHQSVDPARAVSAVTGSALIAGGPAIAAAIASALDYGALAASAQLLGAGRALLAAAVRHARDRVQFGVPVGSFQAVKHQLADVLIGLEFASPLLFGAAVALADGGPTAARDVSAAAVACANAAHRAARVGLQVHGAIGYTSEHDAGLYVTKIEALRRSWGGPGWHRARVLTALTARVGTAGEARATCG